MAVLHADLELARRLEETESFASAAFASHLSRDKPDPRGSVATIAGGRAVYAGPGSPLTEAKAMGLNGPVTDDDLDRLEAFYFGRAEPCRVFVCPLADPSLLLTLAKRGYQTTGFENFLAMPLDPHHHDSLPASGIQIRLADPTEADLYAQVVAPNFAGPEGVTQDLQELVASMFVMEHSAAFLASINGQPAGGGAILIHQGVALLAGAATLPPYRNQGIHAALHIARLDYARQAGCDLAAQAAAPGSTSQRNAERRGLRVAYSRAILVRDPS